jgi:hypothetical protein
MADNADSFHRFIAFIRFISGVVLSVDGTNAPNFARRAQNDTFYAAFLNRARPSMR